MDKLTFENGIENKLPEQCRYYDLSTDNGKIEDYLLTNGLSGIGTMDSWKKLTIGDTGRYRPSSIDLDRNSRAYRTLILKKLSIQDLEKWHTYELEHMDRIMDSCFELHAKLKIYVKPPDTNDEIIQKVIEFQNSNRPECKRFKDCKIHPYNIYNYDFDGMKYHHEWDKLLWYAELNLPKSSEKQLSKRFR